MTLVEIAVGLVVLAVLMAGAFLVMTNVQRLYADQMTAIAMEQSATRVMNRLVEELQGAAPTTITPVALANSDWVRYQQVTGFDGTDPTLGAFEAIRFTLDAGETANGADDDGDGLIDEGVVTHELPGGDTVAIAANVLDLGIDATAAGVRLTVSVGSVDRQGQARQRQLTREISFRNPS